MTFLRPLAFLLSVVLAVPHVWGAPACEDVFANRREETQQIVFKAIDETTELFHLSERKLKKLRTRILKEMSTARASDRLQMERILRTVDLVLESRWLNLQDLLQLDSAALTRRIVVQEKVMSDLRRDLEESGFFDLKKTAGMMTRTRTMLNASPNIRRTVGTVAMNASYFAVMLAVMKITPVMPSDVPLVRIHLPPEALERFAQLRETKSLEEAADIVKNEYARYVYSQASLRVALAVFTVFSTAWGLISMWSNREKLKATAKEFALQLMAMEKKVREEALAMLAAQKKNIEEAIRRNPPAEKRRELENVLKDISRQADTLRNLGAFDLDF